MPATRSLSLSVLSDLEPFYARFGFPPLPELDVTYYRGIQLHGSATRFVKDRDMQFLWQAPSITWTPPKGEEAMVVMMDLDAGGRRSADGAEPGPIGPYVHAMWAHCGAGTLSSCKSLIPYVPPGVSEGTNRYVFLLLRQPPGKALRAVDHTAHFGRWDFGRFLAENFPAGSTKGACRDEAGWDNYSGKGCADYDAEWCTDGAFHVGAEWTGGEQFSMVRNAPLGRRGTAGQQELIRARLEACGCSPHSVGEPERLRCQQKAAALQQDPLQGADHVTAFDRPGSSTGPSGTAARAASRPTRRARPSRRCRWRTISCT